MDLDHRRPIVDQLQHRRQARNTATRGLVHTQPSLCVVSTLHEAVSEQMGVRLAEFQHSVVLAAVQALVIVAYESSVWLAAKPGRPVPICVVFGCCLGAHCSLPNVVICGLLHLLVM